MTGLNPNNGKNRPVDKQMLLSAFFGLVFILGSYSLRELFPADPIIKKLFGGVKLLLFWLASFLIYYKIDTWIFGTKKIDFWKK